LILFLLAINYFLVFAEAEDKLPDGRISVKFSHKKAELCSAFLFSRGLDIQAVRYSGG